MACYRIEGGAILLDLRLTPKAARDSLDGRACLSDGREVALARVRAVPDKGAANKALIALLAKALGVAKSDISLVSGATARLKRLRITGDTAALARIVKALPENSGKA